MLKGGRGAHGVSLAADGPAPNPQAILNSLGSVVTAANSVAGAQQALSSASVGGNGNMLQSAGNAAQALEVRPSMPSACHRWPR